MTRFNSFKVVLRKEFKDAFRDRKSIMLNILLPIIIMPLIFILMSTVMTNTIDKANDSKIAVVLYEGAIDSGQYQVLDGQSDDYDYVTKTIFKTRENVKTTVSTGYSTEGQIKDALVDGDIDAVVYIPKGIQKLIEIDKASNLGINIVYKSSSLTSSVAPETVGMLLKQFQAEVYSQRLPESLKDGVDPGFLNATTVSSIDANDYYDLEMSSASPYLMMVLPVLCVALLTAGGLSMAVDLFAGEKERNTFEPLLSTAGDRMGIVLAKLLVILSFSIGSALLQMLSFIVVFNVMPVSDLFGGMGGNMGALVVAFVSVILMAGLFNSILLAISASSKNSKEANTKGSVLIILPMLISICTMFVDSNIPLWLSFIPIFNTVISLKIALAGSAAWMFMIISIITNAVYLAVAVFYSIKMFSKEKLISKV